MTRYFLKVGSDIRGPLEPKDLKRLFESGSVSPEIAYLRSEDRDQWIPAARAISMATSPPATKLAPSIKKSNPKLTSSSPPTVDSSEASYTLASDNQPASVRPPSITSPQNIKRSQQNRNTEDFDQNSFPTWAIGAVCGLLGLFLGCGVMYFADRLIISAEKSPAVTQNSPPIPGSKPTDSKGSLPARSASSDKSKIEACINGFLREQEMGRNGLSFWKDPSLSTSFFAVRSWKVLEFDVSENSESEFISVRIDASNRGGSQITAIWEFLMRRVGEDWKISVINEKN
jgi:hypothetical protein